MIVNASSTYSLSEDWTNRKREKNKANFKWKIRILVYFVFIIVIYSYDIKQLDVYYSRINKNYFIMHAEKQM